MGKKNKKHKSGGSDALSAPSSEKPQPKRKYDESSDDAPKKKRITTKTDDVGELSFEWAIDPVPLSTFEDEYFEKESLTVNRENPYFNFPELGSIDDFFSLINGSGVIFGTDCDILKYTHSSEDLSRKNLVGIGNKAAALKEYKNGYSVRIKNLHLFSNSVRQMLDKIDAFWGAKGAKAVAYAMPAHGEAVPPSYDVQDCLLLQISGAQKIRFYEPAEGDTQLSLAPCPDLSKDEIGSPRKLVRLSAGGTCYIPRGSIYRCAAVADSPALFIVVYIGNRPTWYDMLQEMIVQTMKEDTLQNRRALPRGFFEYMGVTKTDDETNLDRIGFVQTAGSLALKALDKSEQYIDVAAEVVGLRTGYGVSDFQLGMDELPSGKKLREELRRSGGLVKVKNFLPVETAERILATLENINSEGWASTEAYEDHKENNINHAFLSTKRFPNADVIFRTFKQMFPDLPSVFSAAKYQQSHNIEPHDDRAYKDFYGETYSRDIALIYYLTKDWSEADGGCLKDLKTGKTYVPEFNSIVAFEVPRYHEVTPVASYKKARFSLFGWFHTKGEKYDLYKGDDEEE